MKLLSVILGSAALKALILAKIELSLALKAVKLGFSACWLGFCCLDFGLKAGFCWPESLKKLDFSLNVSSGRRILAKKSVKFEKKP